MDKNQASNESVNQPYKVPSPSWAAFSSGAAYTAFALPFAWVANGLVNLGADRLFEKIPFKQDAWKRFKTLDPIPTVVVSAFIAWDVYKKGKAAFGEAKEAKQQFNKLSIEHDLYREQLTEAGIKPKDVRFVREVDVRTLKLEDKPVASHADKVLAEKAAAAEAVNSK